MLPLPPWTARLYYIGPAKRPTDHKRSSRLREMDTPALAKHTRNSTGE